MKISVWIKSVPSVSPTFTETLMEGEKTTEGETEKQQSGCGGITGAGLQGELLAEGITGSSTGDM